MRRALVALAFLLIPISSEAAVSCSLPGADWDNSDPTDATSYTTASLTFTSGRVYVAFIATRVSAGTANVPSLSSTGMTWARANGGTTDSAASGQQRISAFTGTGSGTGAVTIDLSSQTQLQGLWSILECTGVDTSDPVEAAYAEATGVAVSDTLTFSAFAHADNRPVVGFSTANTTTAADADWTELSDHVVVDTGSDTELSVYWNDATSDTTVTHTTGSNTVYNNVGLELKAGSATTGGVGVLGGGVGHGGVIN